MTAAALEDLLGGPASAASTPRSSVDGAVAAGLPAEDDEDAVMASWAGADAKVAKATSSTAGPTPGGRAPADADEWPASASTTASPRSSAGERTRAAANAAAATRATKGGGHAEKAAAVTAAAAASAAAASATAEERKSGAKAVKRRSFTPAAATAASPPPGAQRASSAAPRKLPKGGASGTGLAAASASFTAVTTDSSRRASVGDEECGGEGEVVDKRVLQLRKLREAQEAEVMKVLTSDPRMGAVILGLPSSRSLYERGMELQAKKAEKVKQLREASKKRELAECRFAPQLRNASPVRARSRGESLADDAADATAACPAGPSSPPRSRRYGRSSRGDSMEDLADVGAGARRRQPSASGRGASVLRCSLTEEEGHLRGRIPGPPDDDGVDTEQDTSRPPSPSKMRSREACDLLLGAQYFTHAVMYDADGEPVPLENRERVTEVLHGLHTNVAWPLCQQFNLRYDFLLEQHCQEKKAGVTRREPRVVQKANPSGTVREETRYLVTVRLRVRKHPARGDPQTDYITEGTQMAVLLHELSHLRHMNHGKDFMFMLRDIFAEATKRGMFDPATMRNELPSQWPWENEIFRTGGAMSREELLRLYEESQPDGISGERRRDSRGPSAAGRRSCSRAASVDLGSSTPRKPGRDCGTTELLDLLAPEPLPYPDEYRDELEGAAAMATSGASPRPPTTRWGEEEEEEDGAAAASSATGTYQSPAPRRAGPDSPGLDVPVAATDWEPEPHELDFSPPGAPPPAASAAPPPPAAPTTRSKSRRGSSRSGTASQRAPLLADSFRRGSQPRRGGAEGHEEDDCAEASCGCGPRLRWIDRRSGSRPTA